MTLDKTLLQEAISAVERECDAVREERTAFAAFRETVSLAKPGPEGDADSSTTREIRETFQETVMEPLDYEGVYGDTLADSLNAEFTSTIADALCSNEAFTQRLKRNLLVATADAIERRERFLAELETEQDALEWYDDELNAIELTVEKLPKCNLRDQPLERVLVVREAYDALEARCERLLERRQRQIRDAERNARTLRQKHALNEYLYGSLATDYPVLSAIAATLERIEAEWADERSPDPPDRMLER